MNNVLRAALAAQACAFLNAATGVASESLARHGVDASSFQSFLNYTALACIYSLLHARALRARGLPLSAALASLSVPLSSYALLALVDVEANFLIVKAFQYTNITSVSLLDACRHAHTPHRAAAAALV